MVLKLIYKAGSRIYFFHKVFILINVSLWMAKIECCWELFAIEVPQCSCWAQQTKIRFWQYNIHIFVGIHLWINVDDVEFKVRIMWAVLLVEQCQTASVIFCVYCVCRSFRVVYVYSMIGVIFPVRDQPMEFTIVGYRYLCLLIWMQYTVNFIFSSIWEST